MPQLDYSVFPSQIFWLIIVFSLIYLFVHFVFMPRISGVINKREAQIDNSINEAEEAKHKAEELRQEYNEEMEKASREANQIIENTYAELKQAREDKKELGRKKIRELESETEKELEKLKENYKKDIDKYAYQNASLILRKLINSKIGASELEKEINNKGS